MKLFQIYFKRIKIRLKAQAQKYFLRGNFNFAKNSKGERERRTDQDPFKIKLEEKVSAKRLVLLEDKMVAQ